MQFCTVLVPWQIEKDWTTWCIFFKAVQTWRVFLIFNAISIKFHSFRNSPVEKHTRIVHYLQSVRGEYLSDGLGMIP